MLRLLSLHSPVAQKELAYLLGIRSQSLAEQIGKLEEAGMVQRRPNPHDRRSSVVELTEKGRQAAEEVSAHPAEDPFEVLDTQEKEQLGGLLDRVIEGMESALPGGPDPRMRMSKQRVYSSEGGFGPGFGPGFGGGPHGRFGGGPGPRFRGGPGDGLGDGFGGGPDGGSESPGRGRGGRGRGRGGRC